MMTAKNLQDRIKLNNGTAMPWFGLGVFKVEEGPELVQAVKTAIKHGYRSIDTAAIYGNEEGVGQGIREGLKEAGISREDLFVTSKVWNDDLGYDETIAAYEASLEKLGLDYLDLYLIHWPVEGRYKAAWKALETLYEQGRVKAIGVSNFQIHHLEDLLKDAAVKPAINQVEYHPRLTQKEPASVLPCARHPAASMVAADARPIAQPSTAERYRGQVRQDTGPSHFALGFAKRGRYDSEVD